MDSSNSLSQSLSSYPRLMKKSLGIHLLGLGVVVLMIWMVFTFGRSWMHQSSTNLIGGALFAFLVLGGIGWAESRCSAEAERILLPLGRVSFETLTSEDLENVLRGYRLRPYTGTPFPSTDADIAVARMMREVVGQEAELSRNGRQVLKWFRSRAAYLKLRDAKTDWSWLRQTRI